MEDASNSSDPLQLPLNFHRFFATFEQNKDRYEMTLKCFLKKKQFQIRNIYAYMGLLHCTAISQPDYCKNWLGTAGPVLPIMRGQMSVMQEQNITLQRGVAVDFQQIPKHAETSLKPFVRNLIVPVSRQGLNRMDGFHVIWK